MSLAANSSLHLNTYNFLFKLINKLKFFIDLNILLKLIYLFSYFNLGSNTTNLKFLRLAILLKKYGYIIFFHSKISKKNDNFIIKKLIFSEVIIYSLSHIGKKEIFNKNKFKEYSVKIINLLVLLKKNNFDINKIYNLATDQFILNKNFKIFINELIHSYIGLNCFCEDLYNLLKFQQVIEFKKKINKNSNKKITVILDDWWFLGFGHYFYLDTLIKGILLKKIPIKHIYIDVKNKNKIQNIYLFEKYHKTLSQLGILLKKKDKEAICLKGFCWFDNSYNLISSDFFVYYINKIWNQKKNKQLINVSKQEKFLFLKLCKNLNIRDSNKIITIHLRQNNKYNFSIISDLRNYNESNLNILFKVLEENKEYTFVILGNKHMNKNNNNSSNIVNYLHSKYKSDINDILLILNSYSHIGNFSGPSHLASLYGIKTLFIDCKQFWNFPVFPNAIFIPALFKKEGKYYPLRKFLKINPPLIYSSEEILRYSGYSIEKNSIDSLSTILREFFIYIKKNNFRIKKIRMKYRWFRLDKSISKKYKQDYYKATVFENFIKLNKRFFR